MDSQSNGGLSLKFLPKLEAMPMVIMTLNNNQLVLSYRVIQWIATWQHLLIHYRVSTRKTSAELLGMTKNQMDLQVLPLHILKVLLGLIYKINKDFYSLILYLNTLSSQTGKFLQRSSHHNKYTDNTLVASLWL